MSPRNRFYGLSVLGLSVLWCAVLFVHWKAQKRAQGRVHEKIEELTSLVKELQNRPSEAATTATTPATASAVAGPSSASIPFRVLGTGRLGPNYTYMDVRHVDGSRRRYYCRNEDGQAGVARMMAIVDADSIDAQYGLLWASDSSVYASMPNAEPFGSPDWE